jgi:peptidoglycan/LPS O-acetylase OafA/YrhL
VLALYVALPAIREADCLPPAWMFLTFTQNLFVDYANDKAFSHAWSLCVEEHFYLLFPTLALVLARRTGTRAVAVVTTLVLLGGIALRAAIWLHALAPLDAMPGAAPGFGARWVEWIYYPTWCRVDGLLFGVLLAAIRTWRPAWWARIERRNGAVALAGVALLALAVAVCADRNGLAASVVGFPLVSLAMALLVASAAAPRGWISRFTPPGAAWIAAASYSLYLVHKAVFATVDRVLPTDASPLMRFVVIGTAAVAAGALLHYTIERPGLRLRGRLLARRAGERLGDAVASRA